MLDFEIEWLEAPGVTSKVLAQTWARLVITAVDVDGKVLVLTRVLSSVARTERDAVYGSVFPLAEWIVENWWFLLHEPSRVPELRPARHLANQPKLLDWARRHNLLAAVHGGAFPDLSIYQDRANIVVQWFADSDYETINRPVRFTGQGEVRLLSQDVERGFETFVQQVLSRLDSETDHEVERLREEWNAIQVSRQDEPNLCTWAASMGIDPYDANELTDDLVEILETRLPELDLDLRSDLVEAATAVTIHGDLDWIRTVRDRLGPSKTLRAGFQWLPTEQGSTIRSAHQWGYKVVQEFRETFALTDTPITDLPGLLHKCCQWPLDMDQRMPQPGATELKAMVAADSQGTPRVFRARNGHASHRFLLARAVYFVPLLQHGSQARLITNAFTWDQAASRAFAAELLAPATALRSRISGSVSPDEVEELAVEFEVSPVVIQHQIKNHHIGWVEE